MHEPLPTGEGVPPDPHLVVALHRATFNAASALFDDPRLGFWDHVGARAADLAGIRPGDRVLDVCCGTGASALPAAERAGPAGVVVGIDVADLPLARARRKAALRGLHNVVFREADMMRLRPARRFDRVLCVLGLYYALDPQRVLALLGGLVRPGGSLLVATWGRHALEPLNGMFWDAVAARRPDLIPAVTSWERMNDEDALRELFAQAGAPAPTVHHERLHLPTSPADAWTVVLGSGYRLAVDAMDAADAEAVRGGLLDRMVAAGVGELVADVLYTRADMRS